MSTTTQVLKTPKWAGGLPENWPDFNRQLMNLVIPKGMAFILDCHQHLGLTAPEDAQEVLQKKCHLFTVLDQALDDRTRSMILTNEIQTAFDPVAYYAAMAKHAQGAVPGLSGPDLHRRAYTDFEHCSKGTYFENAHDSLKEMREIYDMSAALKDANFTLTEAALCAKYKDSLPAELAVYEHHYRAFNTFAELAVHVGRDAKNLDNKERSTVKTFAGKATRANQKHCKVHGWGNHDDSQCYKQHGGGPATEKKPSAKHTCNICDSPDHWARDCPRLSAADATMIKSVLAKYTTPAARPVYHRNDDGTFTVVTGSY